MIKIKFVVPQKETRKETSSTCHPGTTLPLCWAPLCWALALAHASVAVGVVPRVAGPRAPAADAHDAHAARVRGLTSPGDQIGTRLGIYIRHICRSSKS